MDVPLLTAAREQQVATYFEGWLLHLSACRANGAYRPYDAPVPVEAMQAAALFHPDAKRRRACLDVLDHHASDESVEIFRRALHDDVPRVRVIALHGLSCERCRQAELCVADVVPDLVGVLRDDPSPKVRSAALHPLGALAGRDGRIREALEAASEFDPDPLVRDVARRILVDGPRHGYKSRKAMRRRARRRPGY